MEEELAAGELAESVEGPKNLSDSAEGYIPVQWTRKKIALAVAVGVVVAALFLGCAAALYLHRSTLLDRLAHITQMLGCDLKNPDFCLTLGILLRAELQQKRITQPKP